MSLKPFLRNYFLPQPNLQYITIYLNMWTRINTDKDPAATTLLRFLLSLSIYQTFKYLYISLFAPDLVTRIILFDGIYLITQKSGIAELTALGAAMIAAMTYFTYFQGDPYILFEYDNIVFRFSTDTYIWSKYRRVHVSQIVRTFAQRCLLLGPFFAGIAYLALLYGYLSLGLLIYRHCDHFTGSLSAYLNILHFLLNALLGSSVLVGLMHIWYLCFINAITLSMVTFVRMNQIDLFLATRFKYRRTHITLIHSILVKSLELINRTNRQQGNIFLAFFGPNIPINIFCVFVALFKPIRPVEGFFLIFFASAQMVGIFGVHFGVSKYTKRIHSPAKSLYHHLVHNREQHGRRLKSHFKLSWCIATLHTTQPYGITYGPFGLVTMRTFTKFALLYAKGLLIVYKMAHKRA